MPFPPWILPAFPPRRPFSPGRPIRISPPPLSAVLQSPFSSPIRTRHLTASRPSAHELFFHGHTPWVWLPLPVSCTMVDNHIRKTFLWTTAPRTFRTLPPWRSSGSPSSPRSSMAFILMRPGTPITKGSRKDPSPCRTAPYSSTVRRPSANGYPSTRTAASMRSCHRNDVRKEEMCQRT